MYRLQQTPARVSSGKKTCIGNRWMYIFFLKLRVVSNVPETDKQQEVVLFVAFCRRTNEHECSAQEPLLRQQLSPVFFCFVFPPLTLEFITQPERQRTFQNIAVNFSVRPPRCCLINDSGRFAVRLILGGKKRGRSASFHRRSAG